MNVAFLLLAASLPVFRGYEASRYQQHDKLIVKYVTDFNERRGVWAGATDEQTGGIQYLDPALVKAHMIEETGGNDSCSRAAWAVDPLQVNVPGDWSPYKKYLGLKKPRHRNEGTREKNIRAGIAFLVRKGFGKAGQPAANRPSGVFDSWNHALQRYNGRQDVSTGGRHYCEVYADSVELRSTCPEKYIPIEH